MLEETNLSRLQDTKSTHKKQLHFYTLSSEQFEEELRKQFHL